MSSFYSRYDAYEKLPSIEIKHRILVLYEGSVTEKTWLNEIRKKYNSVKLIDCGHHTVANYKNLIKKIYDEIGTHQLEPLDEVAYIFDLDVFSGENSYHTIPHLESIIAQNKFNLFYTNNSFEFFLLLHYTNSSMVNTVACMNTVAINRALVEKRLKNGINTKHLNQNISDIVKNKTIIACNNAKFIEENLCHSELSSKPKIEQMKNILNNNINFTNLHHFIKLLEDNKN